MGPLDKINPQNKDKIIQAHLQQEIDTLQSKVNNLQKKYDEEANKLTKDGIGVELEAEKILLASKKEVLEALLKGTSTNEETENNQLVNAGEGDANLEENEEPGNPEIEEKKEIDEETMNKLIDQMKAIFEVEKKIEELKQEKFELEQFITDQEKLEKEQQLKEKALEVIKAAKKARMKRDDPLLTSKFSQELIDEVYDNENLDKPEAKIINPDEVVTEPVIKLTEEEIIPPVIVTEETPVQISEEEIIPITNTEEPKPEALTPAQELKANFYGAAPSGDGFVPTGGIKKEITSYTPLKFENIPNQDKAYAQLITTPEFMKLIKNSPLTYIQSIYEPTSNSVPYEDMQNLVILKHAVFTKESGGWRIKDKGIVRLEK